MVTDGDDSTLSTITATTTNTKGKGHPRTGYKVPDGEQVYSSTLPLTSAPDGVGSQHHAPATLPPGKTRYPLYWRLD